MYHTSRWMLLYILLERESTDFCGNPEGCLKGYQMIYMRIL